MSQPAHSSDFTVTYDIAPPVGVAPQDFAHAIALEQTVELDDDLLHDAALRTRIVGRIGSFIPMGQGTFRVQITYHGDVSGGELLHYLNVLFGNISLKPGIRLVDAELDPRIFRGPKFGITNLRRILDQHHQPLLCTALKPMGSSLETLADLAFHMAAGGLHILKDDHGLANQPSHPAHERIPRIADALARAERESGHRCLYFPHFMPRREAFDSLLERCREVAVAGLLVCPMLLGFDNLHYLAQQTDFMIMVHPSWLGPYVLDQRIDPAFLIGSLMRGLGADASIYPNVGGRFSFQLDTCHQINHGLRTTESPFKPSFPVPAGGMTVDRIPELVDQYGKDFIMLMGSGLYRLDTDPRKAVHLFRRAVDAACA